IVFKLFERMVLSEIGIVVSEANLCLVDAGILPDLKAPPIRPARSPGAARPSASSSGTAEVGEGVQMFGLLQELLSTLRLPAAGTGVAGLPLSAGIPAASAMDGPTNIAVMHNGVPVVNG